MIIVVGPRTYGKVQVVGDAYVETVFTCVNFLPIAPSESRLVMGKRAGGVSAKVVALEPHPLSIALGYARPWSLVALASVLVACVRGGMPVDRGALALLFAAAAACVVVWGVLRRVPADGRARLVAYAEVAGYPVDPALLEEEARDALGARLRGDLASRAPSLARATYRDAPAAAWEDVATDPTTADPDFLRSAMVLARLESRGASLEVRRRLARVHDEAWRKVRYNSAR